MADGMAQFHGGRLSAKAQPGERVREYLFAEFSRPDIKPGVRLPSIRELAAHLHVSAPTVQQVFSRLTRQGLIRTEVGKGSFLVSLPEDVKADELTIALSVSLSADRSSPDWGNSIGRGIWEAAIHAPRRLNMTPLSHLEDTGQIIHELQEICDRVDALILLPIWGRSSKEITDFYESRGKPVVHINPPIEHATGNFVSANYFESARILGTAWREAGRRDIVYIGPDMASRSISTRLHCQGLMSGLQVGLDSSIRFRRCCSASTGVQDGYDVMRKLLTSSAPDAVFCSGDYFAAGAIRALLEQGAQVPEQVSVVGGTGLRVTQSPIPCLTRSLTPFSRIGNEAIAMVEWRCDRSGEAAPGHYLPLPFGGGATTTDGENDLLGVRPNDEASETDRDAGTVASMRGGSPGELD